jgi:hypothetical protein
VRSTAVDITDYTRDIGAMRCQKPLQSPHRHEKSFCSSDALGAHLPAVWMRGYSFVASVFHSLAFWLRRKPR